MAISFDPNLSPKEGPMNLIENSLIYDEPTSKRAQEFFSQQEALKEFCEVLDDSRKWESITDLSVTFDAGFLIGVATCTYQDSGAFYCPDSQWVEWENKSLPEENRSEKSAGLFALYQTKEGRAILIDRLQKLRVNAYRFSIEWSHIQPEKDNWDDLKLQVYVELCKELRDSGIQPMITLHHFSEPKWFHLLGSFEKEENIFYFVEFSEKVFKFLIQDYKGKPLVEYFCTINEPGIEAFSRYVRGSFSPGYRLRFIRAGQFLKNMLKAHCVTYKTLKPICPNVQIGITHQRLVLVGTHPIIDWFLHYINLLVNETILQLFKTGVFDYNIPFCSLREEMHPQTDFIGLQYYTVALIGWTGSTSYYEKMTEMPFREYPEGLYPAILEAYRSFRVPIFITENGISTHDEGQRFRYIERALYATHLAQQIIGVKNVLGYFLWSFCDNFEWDMGMHPQAFGAYQLNADGSLADDPKNGVLPLIQIAQAKKLVDDSTSIE